MNNIDKIFDKKPQVFWKSYLDYLSSVLNNISSDEVAAFIGFLLNARESGAMVFFIGNGGSAATASHFANDLAIGTRQMEKPFRVLSLTDNIPVITALGNDYGYREIFNSQLKIYASPGDILVGISASGNSPNLVSAFEYGNSVGLTTLAITAFDGGKLRKMAHAGIHVPTESGEYGPAEDAHMVLDHFVSAYLLHFLNASK